MIKLMKYNCSLKKHIVLLISVFVLSFESFGQQLPDGFEMEIMDTVAVLKNGQDAVRLFVKITNNDSDALSLFRFGKYVLPNGYYTKSMEVGRKTNENVGLIYVVEDDSGSVIHLSEPAMMAEYKNEDDWLEISKTVWVVDEPELSANAKIIDDVKELKEFNYPTFNLISQDSTLSVYLMFKQFNLPPGQYRVWLLFSEGSDDRHLPRCVDKSEYYWGKIVSNAIDLIIEEEPPKWWQFWKKK